MYFTREVLENFVCRDEDMNNAVKNGKERIIHEFGFTITSYLYNGKVYVENIEPTEREIDYLYKCARLSEQEFNKQFMCNPTGTK